nr:ribonuclease H-like domain-containing protein [Tanacetum cinerariifolium]
MVVYLLNILPSRAINNEIPFTCLFGAQPDYSVLRVFGCLCYPQIDTNHKLGPHATPSILLGHAANHFGYRCLDLNTNKIIISRHVTFDETVFPFPFTKSTTTPSYDFLDDSTDLISIITHTAPITPVPAPDHTTQVDVPTPPTPHPPPTPQSILKRAHMVGCNPSWTHVDIESKLGDGGTPVVNPTLYRSLAGASFLCSQADFGYVQGISDYGLQLFSSTNDSFIAYSDADWAGCLTMRRSTSGYCVFLGNNLLLWSSKRQPMLSRYSDEAEYHSVANAVIKTYWIQNLLHELHTPLSSATIMYCDNAFEDDVALPVELAKARSSGRLATYRMPTPSLISSKPARELEGSNGSKMAGKYKRSVLDDPGSGGSMRRT